MTIIRTLAVAAGLMTLAACGGNEPEENAGMTLEANTLVVDNVTDVNADLNAAMNMDANMDMNDHSNMDMNADANAAANATNAN